jgi:nicotinamidase-related amidase
VTLPLAQERAALLVYDMAEPAASTEPSVVAALPRFEQVVSRCRQAGVPVCYAFPARDLAHTPLPIAAAIGPRPGERVLGHVGSGAFTGTDLEDYLRDHGRSALLITGMAVDRGCNMTARDALNRGVQPILVRGLCFTRDILDSPVGPVPKADVERVHLAALHRIGAGIMTADEVLAALA